MCWCTLGQVGRYNRQQTCGDGQSDEGIVTGSLEGEGGHQGQGDKDSTDAGQPKQRRRVVGGARQSAELTRNGPRHWFHGFISGAALRKARLAGANPPARKRVEWPASSSCSQRNVLRSSTSYHSGSSVVASPISAARSQVLRATVSVPHAI